MIDEVLKTFVDELVNQHDCHSIILYGSRARGDFDQDSDYDLAGFRKNSQSRRLSYHERDIYLDAFIYNDQSINDESLLEFLKLRQGVILLEKNGFASNLLVRLDEFFNKGPAILAADEKQAIRIWAKKMIKRIQKGDIEGNYRLHHLLNMLLEDYFILRDLWFLGSKESWHWLEKNDQQTYALFDQSLKPNAETETIAQLIERVIK